MEDSKGGSQNIKGEQEEDQSLPTEDMGGGGCGKLTTNQLPMREKGTVRISQSPIKGSGKFLSWLIQNPPKPTTPPPKRQ